MHAVLVSDMQNDILAKGAVLEHHGVAEAIVPGIQELLQVARKERVPIIYTQLTDVRGDPLFEWAPPHCVPGTRGIEIIAELKPEEGDYVVSVYRMNQFLFSNLEYLLRMLNASTLIISGINTDTGCLLTAMDAFQRGFDVIIVTDCCASWNEEKHQTGLDYLKPFKDFIEQLTLEQTIARLEGRTKRPPRKRRHES